ncbi:MAG: T9SS type A sorting domain-containing protein [Candidatus Cloacimonetes bacterium]|nr:T9SS type A sorting domain-containing protein [Candidatus Cloacimonadota bacterium]
MKNLIIVALLILMIPSTGIAEVVIIPDDYTAIQQGIDAASPADTIKVKYDTYNESLKINKDILITKYGSQKPIITNPVGATITIENANAVVSGFDVQTSHLYGTGILIFNTESSKIEDCTLSKLFTGICAIESSVNIERCILFDNDIGIYFSGDGVVSQVMNCTLYRNQTGIYTLSKSTRIMNTILFDNSNVDIVGSPDVTYSSIEDWNTGTGNIDDDPQFEDAENGDFHLKWDSTHFSPCIDTGDPDMDWDDDNTPPDMGAIAAVGHKWDSWNLPKEEGGEWRWMCYPVLNRITNTPEDADMAMYLFEDIIEVPYIYLDEIQWRPVGDPSNIQTIYYDEGTEEWQNTDHIVTSRQGYKFKMFNEEPVPINISGFLESSDTEIPLVADENENWIGYFLEENQDVNDAFEGSMDNLYFIQTQNWTYQREEPIPGSPWIRPQDRRVINYGDCVVVKCFNNDEDFVWSFEGGKPPQEREQTDYFEYEEEADYVPIYVELDPDDMPTEVAVFVDDECMGAEKVTSEFVQIRSYVLDGTTGEINIGLYYGEKNGSRKFKDYFIYEPVRMNFYKGTIKLNEIKDYYMISLRENSSTYTPSTYLISSFPNPVTQDVNVQYIVPKDEKISLEVYNCRGQYVTTLVDGEKAKGFYSVRWDAKDKYGKNLANGVYFFRLSTSKTEVIEKMLIMK